METRWQINWSRRIRCSITSASSPPRRWLIWASGASMKMSLTQEEKRWLKRRQAIEPMIDHTKSDNRIDRCWLKGVDGRCTACAGLCCGLLCARYQAGFFAPVIRGCDGADMLQVSIQLAKEYYCKLCRQTSTMDYNEIELELGLSWILQGRLFRSSILPAMAARFYRFLLYKFTSNSRFCKKL